MNESSSDSVISIAGLTKSFGTLHALTDLNLTVGRGEVHGFLGPNGAGKSTTIRILLGLQRADSGKARLFGQDSWRDAVSLHRRLAYVPGDVTLWPGMTVGETIEMLLSLRGAMPHRTRELAERFQLDLRRPCRGLSKGNRQKVALVAAFAGQSELLLLDEPTSGLDPLMEEAFVASVQEAAARETTILLSSHILAEVERLCGRVTIIRNGHDVASGTLDELRARAVTRFTVEFRPGTMPELAGVAGVEQLSTTACSATFIAEQRVLPGVLDRLAQGGVVQLTCHPPRLEELFLEHYEARSSDEVPA